MMPPKRNARVSPSPDLTEPEPLVLVLEVEVVLVVEEELEEEELELLEPPLAVVVSVLPPPPLPPLGFFHSTVLPDSAESLSGIVKSLLSGLAVEVERVGETVLTVGLDEV